MDYLKLKELRHSGIKGMKWGQRRYQNEDGSLTPEGMLRYGIQNNMNKDIIGKTVRKFKNQKENVRTNDLMDQRDKFYDAQDRKKELEQEIKNLRRKSTSPNLNFRERRLNEALAKSELKIVENDIKESNEELKKMIKNPNYSPTLDRQKNVAKKIISITGKTSLGAMGGLDETLKQKGFGDKNYPKGFNGLAYKLQDVMSGGLTAEGNLKKGSVADKFTGIGGILTGAITESGLNEALNKFANGNSNNKKIKHNDYSDYVLVNTSEGLGVYLMHKTVPQGKTVEQGKNGGNFYTTDSGKRVYVGKDYKYSDNSGNNRNNKTDNSKIYGNVDKHTERKGNQENKQEQNNNQNMTVNFDGSFIDKIREGNPGKSENQNGKQNADNANPNKKQNETPGTMTTAEMQKKMSNMYLNRSGQFKALQGAGYGVSKMVGQIGDAIPHVPGKKTYGTYDDISTKELKNRIDRINTERNYSDLIGDTKYTKSGADKLKDILGYAGSALAIATTGMGILASINAAKASKIKPS